MDGTLIDKSIDLGRGDCQVPGELPAGTTPLLTLTKELERTPGAVAVSDYTAENQGGAAPPGNSPKSPYKEPLAKRSLFQNEDEYLLSKITTKCPGYWIPGYDDAGNRYAMELFCGREWCPVCGKRGSKMHDRRFARLLPRATQMKTMGYFVIEWPIASRGKLRTKAALSRAGVKARRTFKDLGYARGLTRWHYFGDKAKRYNPHLNILVDGMYIPDSRLESIKTILRKRFNEPDLIVNYSYRKTPGEMVHTLKYITRATFLDATWDVPMALELRGFRNQSWWGSNKWTDPPAWSLDDLSGEAKKEVADMDYKAIESLQSGVSPRTGRPITWEKPVPISVLNDMKKRGKVKALGAGYYELEPVGSAPPGIPPDVLARLDGVRLKRKAEYLAKEAYENELMDIADRELWAELGVEL